MANATASATVHPNARAFDIGRIFIYTVLIVGAAAAIFPFLYTVSVSLMNLTEATGGAFYPGQLASEGFGLGRGSRPSHRDHPGGWRPGSLHWWHHARGTTGRCHGRCKPDCGVWELKNVL